MAVREKNAAHMWEGRRLQRRYAAYEFSRSSLEVKVWGYRYRRVEKCGGRWRICFSGGGAEQSLSIMAYQVFQVVQPARSVNVMSSRSSLRSAPERAVWSRRVSHHNLLIFINGPTGSPMKVWRQIYTGHTQNEDDDPNAGADLRM